MIDLSIQRRYQSPLRNGRTLRLVRRVSILQTICWDLVSIKGSVVQIELTDRPSIGCFDKAAFVASAILSEHQNGRGSAMGGSFDVLLIGEPNERCGFELFPTEEQFHKTQTIGPFYLATS